MSSHQVSKGERDSPRPVGAEWALAGHGPSILSPYEDAGDDAHTLQEPSYFRDLLLDQVVTGIVGERSHEHLAHWFWEREADPAVISYRHEVWRDLTNEKLVNQLSQFESDMKTVLARLSWSAKASNVHHRQGLVLDAARTFDDAVSNLGNALDEAPITSRGLTKFRESLRGYVNLPQSVSRRSDASSTIDRLSRVSYCLRVQSNRVRIRRYDGEADFGAVIEETFIRFRQGAVTDYRAAVSNWPDLNHIESAIVDRVAQLFPVEFAGLQKFSTLHADFYSGPVVKFSQEIQFYLAYLEFIGPLKERALSFCLPTFSGAGEPIFATDTFDIALAAKRSKASPAIVTNDFRLDANETVLLVSGPNQGGKTTFARAFGQVHHLAMIGCPVPGRDAAVRAFDELFTHFGREEDETLSAGKLEDDLLRIRDVLVHATTSSIIIMNEIFASTTARDAAILGEKVLAKILELGSTCVIVTFIDELVRLDARIVSMTGTVEPDNPAVRTFRILRQPADGKAYAMAIANKYGLSYEALRRRLAR